MGFLDKMFSAITKTALTPITLVKDVVDVVNFEPADTSISLLESAAEDVFDAVDDIFGESDDWWWA